MSWNNSTNRPSGDARNFQPTNDEWNDASANSNNWTNGGGADNHSFSGNNNFGLAITGDPARESNNDGALGACFNCGSDAHQKKDCPEPRKFSGECRTCGQTGHPAKDCPTKPKICRQCLVENDHDTIDCKNKKVIDMSDVPDKSENEAWCMMREASIDREIGDFKDALKILSKANPELTYLDVEAECRRQNLSIYLIALKKEVDPTYTNTNLQGEVGKTYQVGYYFSHLCQRPVLMPFWPKDVEDNKARLADAGIPLPRGVIICGNCSKPGHARKSCPEPLDEGPGAPKIVCALCSEEGHRVRDCVQERKKPRGPRTCKVCGSEDHLVAECPEKPKMVCRNCEQEGHKASECQNERVMRCRNCEEVGHMSKECPKPKDWSKVKCQNCGEFGHGKARCKLPPKEEPADDFEPMAGDEHGAADNGNSNGATSNGNWNTAYARGDEWQNGGASDAKEEW